MSCGGGSSSAPSMYHESTGAPVASPGKVAGLQPGWNHLSVESLASSAAFTNSDVDPALRNEPLTTLSETALATGSLRSPPHLLSDLSANYFSSLLSSDLRMNDMPLGMSQLTPGRTMLRRPATCRETTGRCSLHSSHGIFPLCHQVTIPSEPWDASGPIPTLDIPIWCQMWTTVVGLPSGLPVAYIPRFPIPPRQCCGPRRNVSAIRYLPA